MKCWVRGVMEVLMLSLCRWTWKKSIWHSMCVSRWQSQFGCLHHALAFGPDSYTHFSWGHPVVRLGHTELMGTCCSLLFSLAGVCMGKGHASFEVSPSLTNQSTALDPSVSNPWCSGYGKHISDGMWPCGLRSCSWETLWAKSHISVCGCLCVCGAFMSRYTNVDFGSYPFRNIKTFHLRSEKCVSLYHSAVEIFPNKAPQSARIELIHHPSLFTIINVWTLKLTRIQDQL